MLKVILFILWLISLVFWIFFTTEAILEKNNYELKIKYCIYMWIACVTMNIMTLLMGW